MYISARWGSSLQQINKYIRICAHPLAFRVDRSCRRWAAVFPLATILASARRPRLIDLESRAMRCTPTLQYMTCHYYSSLRKRRAPAQTVLKGNVWEGDTYLVLRGSRSQQFDQSLRQSCGMRQGMRLCARDRGDRARRGGIMRIRRSRGNACPSHQRRHRRRRLTIVAGPE